MTGDLTGLVALGGVVVSLSATLGTYLNNRRQQQTSTVTASSTVQAEAQRLALEGLRELIEQQQDELARKTEEVVALRARCAEATEALGILQLRHQEALAQLDEQGLHLEHLEATLAKLGHGG